MSDKIAFIGVGNMGNPMAENLLKSGKKITVFDVSKEMMEQAKKKGLNTSESIESLINDEVSIVITMLPEGKNSKEIYLGDNGIINKVSILSEVFNPFILACSIISFETSNTVIFLPDLCKFSAIGFPIFPTPIKAIVSLI